MPMPTSIKKAIITFLIFNLSLKKRGSRNVTNKGNVAKVIVPMATDDI